MKSIFVGATKVLPMVVLMVGLLPSVSLAQSKIVFVTSEETDGSIEDSVSTNTGIQGADDICSRLATAAGLDMSNGAYMAWLSDDSTSPAARFTQATVPYVRTDGTQIADNWADLVDGTLDTVGLSGIEYTENAVFVNTLGGDLASSVWTGTNSDGTAATDHCTNWTSTAVSGLRGATNRSTSDWTALGATSCANETRYRLFCFQQGPVPVELQQLSID